MTPTVLVSGYTSIDTRLVTAALPRPGETAILAGEPRPLPQWGGCAPIVACWLCELGVPAALVAWFGDDEEGRAYRELLAGEGVDLRLVAVGDAPSPRSWLVSDADGASVCLFHPSGAEEQRFVDDPAALADTGWLAVTVGPAGLTRSLIEAFAAPLASGAVRLAWDVKADRRAFPPPLVRRLVQADLVCLNEAEAAFLGPALGLRSAAAPADLLAHGAAVVALTRGARGAVVAWAGGEEELLPPQVSGREPTGAGDALFAGMLAALQDGAEPPEACRRGLDTAARHLAVAGA
jgi:sugar/nucleoside kinase (ribokinase family)